MNYEQLVPQRLDFFAFVIFLGVVQGFLFSYFLLKKRAEFNAKNHYLGLFLLINTSVLLEVFLCYSGLIVHTLWLVDYSEATNFLSGPLIYFLILSYFGNGMPKRRWLHFIPFILYLGYMVLFFIQSNDYKFNAYIDAYYPDIPKIDSPHAIDPDPLGIKRYINEISVIYTGIYLLFGIREIALAVKQRGVKLFKGAISEIAWIRNLLFLGLANYLFWFTKSFTGIRDVQDHIGAAMHTVVIYYVGLRIMQQGFVNSSKSGEKYAKSSLSEDRKNQILQKLEGLKSEGPYYLDSNLSMADLARNLGTSGHHLSQVLNESLGKSYGEYINSLRIAHAQTLLIEQPNVKIEEIAEQSGFNSKSTFNTAFKKLTGQTPSQYRNSQNQ